MFRVIFRVERVPQDIGRQAADDITKSFQQRPWHAKAVCLYEQDGLTFMSENYFDFNARATQDELSDEISANMRVFGEDDGNLTVVGIEEF